MSRRGSEKQTGELVRANSATFSVAAGRGKTPNLSLPKKSDEENRE